MRAARKKGATVRFGRCSVKKKNMCGGRRRVAPGEKKKRAQKASSKRRVNSLRCCLSLPCDAVTRNKNKSTRTRPGSQARLGHETNAPGEHEDVEVQSGWTSFEQECGSAGDDRERRAIVRWARILRPRERNTVRALGRPTQAPRAFFPPH